MVIDNGGAIAQKGFNYQNHVIALVAIKNYHRKNFEIFVETNDDCEVLYDNYHAYIQVKGLEKVSVADLLKKNKNKCSILEKHFTPGDENSKYKIVILQFKQGELNDLKANKDELFDSSWNLIPEKQKYILNKLPNEFKKQDKHLKTKLNNFSFVKTSFSNNSVEARKYLKGELVTQKISVDGRDDVILDELNRIISQKSEIVLNDGDDKKLKRITADELQLILKKISSKALFDSELEKFSFPSYRKEIIKREEIRIITQYMHEKKEIIKLLKSDIQRLKTKHLSEIVDEIIGWNILEKLEDEAKYAVIISAYCDILEGVTNE